MLGTEAIDFIFKKPVDRFRTDKFPCNEIGTIIPIAIQYKLCRVGDPIRPFGRFKGSHCIVLDDTINLRVATGTTIEPVSALRTEEIWLPTFAAPIVSDDGCDSAAGLADKTQRHK